MICSCSVTTRTKTRNQFQVWLSMDTIRQAMLTLVTTLLNVKHGKDFQHMSKLQTHLKVHTGKPFIWAICGKTFKNGNEQSRHTSTHTAEKPHSCATCGKAFKRASRLHTRGSTRMRSLMFATRGDDFRDNSGLSSRTSVHTGPKTRTCSCGDAFNGLKWPRNGLLRHMRVHMSVEACGASCSG